VELPPTMVAVLAKYTAKERLLSYVRMQDGYAYAHDAISALRVPATGTGYLSRKVLEWGGTDTARYYYNTHGSFVREPGHGAVLFDGAAQNLHAWPVSIAQVFTKLENFPMVFSVPAKSLQHVLQAYGALDTEQSIRLCGAAGDGSATVTIQGTRAVVEDELPASSESDFTAVLAISTLLPFLAACPEANLYFQYEDNSPYLVSVDGWDACLLTPRVA